MRRESRKLETWMFGFITGLVIAIALGAGASRLNQRDRSPRPVQLGPKGKVLKPFPLFTRWAAMEADVPSFMADCKKERYVA